MAREQYELTFRRGAEEIEQVVAHLDIEEEDELRKHLEAAVGRYGGDLDDLGEYSMAVRLLHGELEFTYVAVHRD